MQVVIEISEEVFNLLASKQKAEIPMEYVEKIFTAISNGTPITEQSDAFNLSSFRRGMARAFEILKNIADKEREDASSNRNE